MGETLRFSIPIVPLQISTFVLSASDRFIVLRDLGPAATGRYQVAYTLGAVGVSLLTFLNLAWLPRIFAIADRGTRAAVLAASRDGLYRLLVPVTIGIALGGPLVLHIWAPRDLPHREPHPGRGPGRGLDGAGVHRLSSTRACILSEGRSAVVALVPSPPLVINVGLNLALVPHLGINGSALATLITYAVLASGMAAVSRQLLPLPRPARRSMGAAGGGHGHGAVHPLPSDPRPRAGSPDGGRDRLRALGHHDGAPAPDGRSTVSEGPSGWIRMGGIRP